MCSSDLHSMDTIKFEREDDGTTGRFIIYDGEIFAGEMTYKWADSKTLLIDHTRIKEAFGGRGLGKLLVAEAVKFAREQGIKIIPLCPFVKAIFNKVPSLEDVEK